VQFLSRLLSLASTWAQPLLRFCHIQNSFLRIITTTLVTITLLTIKSLLTLQIPQGGLQIHPQSRNYHQQLIIQTLLRHLEDPNLEKRLKLHPRNPRCQRVQIMSTLTPEMVLFQSIIATVQKMTHLVLLVTVLVSIPLVLPSTLQHPSPPTMVKTILDEMPFVIPHWTTEGFDLMQNVVLSIAALTVMTLDRLQGIKHSLIKKETENVKENVKESVNGDVIVTETVLNTVVVPMDAVMLLDLPQNNAIMSPDIHLTTSLLAAMIQKTIWM
jgi:hypothetical protein